MERVILGGICLLVNANNDALIVLERAGDLAIALASTAGDLNTGRAGSRLTGVVGDNPERLAWSEIDQCRVVQERPHGDEVACTALAVPADGRWRVSCV